MQLSSSFDQGIRVEKSVIQTLACQLASSRMQRFSFNPDARVEKTLKKTLASQAISTLMQLMQKLFDKLSLDNSHQLSCNSYSRLTKTWELRKLSLQTHACQHSLTLMQLLSSIDQDIRVQKTVIQTLVFPLSCNACSRLLGMRVEKTVLQTFAYQLLSTLVLD